MFHSFNEFPRADKMSGPGSMGYWLRLLRDRGRNGNKWTLPERDGLNFLNQDAPCAPLQRI